MVRLYRAGPHLTAGQLDYLRGRPLYPWVVWIRRAIVIFVLFAMGGSMVGADGFALSLFCFIVTLVPFMAATEYLVVRQLEQIVLGPGKYSFRLRVACSYSIWADVFAIRRQ